MWSQQTVALDDNSNLCIYIWKRTSISLHSPDANTLPFSSKFGLIAWKCCLLSSQYTVPCIHYYLRCFLWFTRSSNLFIQMPIYVITHPIYMSCQPLSQYSPTEDLNKCHYDLIKYSQRIDWRAAPEILSTTFFTTHSVQYMVAVDKKS